MATFDGEAALFDPVAAYVRRKSFRWQERELRFYDCRIDLFAYSRALGLTIAVEMKVNRWRRALEQALLYQLCADHVLVALPQAFVHRADAELLAGHGVGLLAVHASGRCRQLLAAQQSKVLRPHYRERYITLLEG